MDKQFISEPMDFQYKEGKSVDFEKTFDLTGNDNDEMLRVYLKKAGLSENIECLSAEQRKALIYDIVKSNKNPGYWKPSVVPFMTPKTTNQTQLSSSITLPSIDDIPPASMTFDYAQFAQLNGSDSKDNGKYVSDVSNREQQQAVRGTLFERQFQQPKIYNTPPTPPSPSTLVKRKGLTIEISGPVNFQHVSGDMTRDMTKNAFDLSGQFNDNSLKKYMIERGITEEDVAGIETKELIRRIVQSRFTWMPALRYTGNHIPPPPSETFRPPSPSPPSRHKPTSKGGALIVAPPKPPEEGSPSENIYLEIIPTGSSPVTRRPVKSPPPPPPSAGVKHTFSSGKHNPPPPPPQALNTTSSVQVEKMATERTIPPPPPPMAVISNSGGGPPPPPPPVSSVNTRVGGPPPPPPPPMPSLNTSAGGPPPPPPPPMASHNTSTGGPFPPPLPKSETTKKPIASGVDNRDAFLESIRAGVTLKKLNKPNEAKSNTGSIKISSNNLSQQPNPPDSIKQKPTKVEPLDLMSELRNATLKRIKKLENNPYAGEGQESNC